MSVDNTMGATLIGVVCAAILYGASCVQTWYYFEHYQKDAWYIRAFVSAIWILDTIHQTLISHSVYTYLVTNYNNPAALDQVVWSVYVEIVFNALIGLLVQGFFAIRVWRFSDRNTLLFAPIFGLILANFACALAYTAQATQTWAESPRLKGLSIAVNALGAISDVLIAGTLCYFLQVARNGLRKSDNMVTTLIMFAITTGLFTSLCAIASLVSILVWGHTLIYVAFYFTLGRLYSNSVLATLNARDTIRKIGENGGSMSFRWAASFIRRHPESGPVNIGTKVDITQHSGSDDSDTRLQDSSIA